jgi:hypothetical protein
MSVSILEQAGVSAATETIPEMALRAVLMPFYDNLGDRKGSFDLPEGVSQFFVAGAFLVTPDQYWHMLAASLGFPSEQNRLMIPIDGGHPGWVRATGEALYLPDTNAEAGKFKQYLKTARMGSAIYAPMIWQGKFLGQIVMAGRARNSLHPKDFALMRAAAPLAAAVYVAKGWFGVVGQDVSTCRCLQGSATGSLSMLISSS